MIRAHVDVVLARLRGDAVLAGATFDGRVEGTPEAYCVVYAGGGVRKSERLTGRSVFADFSFTIHSVGSTAEQARLVEERVLAQLVDWVPTVVGRNCRRMVHAVSRPVGMDNDVSPPLFYGVDVF
ncbi:MAG: hypothetical protein ACYC6C_08055, partial [Coriobacteriia bacterium]